jgi:hypothetical protein
MATPRESGVHLLERQYIIFVVKKIRYVCIFNMLIGGHFCLLWLKVFPLSHLMVDKT